MTFTQWKAFIKEFIDEIQKQPSVLISSETRTSLKEFQKHLETPRNAQQRKRFEQKLEAFIIGNPALKKATERHLKKRIPVTIEKAVSALLRANAYLERYGRKKLREFPN
jgi:uncharacterized Rossmann fold enzyme